MKADLPELLTPENSCPAVYTGNKLAKTNPEKYARIVQNLGEGKPMSRIAKSEKVSPSTISVILKREQRSVDAVQSLTAGLTSYASQATLLKIIDKLEKDEIPPGVLPVLFGIVRDKEKSDLNQATHIIEHKTSVTIDDVKKELDDLRRDAVEVEVEDEG
jgi:hypothetical protein